MTLPKLKAKLQKLFNEFIRLRDHNQPCISCGFIKPLQAGHYYPVKGYDGLRFEEDNVHGECSGCNCFDEGHLIHYGKNLVHRIGDDRVKTLELKAQAYKMQGYKFTRGELEEKIKEYKEKIKHLKP